MKMLLFVVLSVATWLPLSGQAEIYKWKDSNGVTRYSDVPPPSNVPHQPLSGKKAVPAKSTATQAQEARPEQGKADQVKPEQVNKEAGKAAQGRDEAAMKRQAEAEAAKRKAQEDEAKAKAKQENCANAQSRLHTYTQGGRISHMNEKGERELLDDAAIAKGLEQARQDVETYCE